MPTSQQVFEPIILSLAQASTAPVHIDVFYQAVEASVVFQPDDLQPPNLKGLPTKEPRWKRNVRNTLQHLKERGHIVNDSRELWRSPSPDPLLTLDPNQAWPQVVLAAMQAMGAGTVFSSTHSGQQYRVHSVEATRLHIERLDANKPEVLTQGEVRRSIVCLNAAGGGVGRRTLNYTVAKEVATVFLHPRLAWDSASDRIRVLSAAGAEHALAPTASPKYLGAVPKPQYQDFGEAPNDDPEKLQQFARRVRKGQPKFRARLLKIYEDTCAITGAGPAAVLEAAHILPHAGAGINRDENGILLRADLHVLFDEGLLRIHPEDLTVVIAPSVKERIYRALHGRPLRPRKDAKPLSSEYLQKRWES